MRISPKLTSQSDEITANKYAIYCINITMVFLVAIWILNLLNVFVVSKKVMTCCVCASIVVYVIGIICQKLVGIKHPSAKYFIVLWTITITTIMGCGLTYHAIIASVLPILLCSMYSSKRLTIFTSILVIVSTFVTVFVGYYFGICDANMTLLTGEPLSEYINSEGIFTRTDINSNPLWSLTLFFVFPRSLLYMMCIIVSHSISKIIRTSTEHAKQMESLAEIDGMTGLYNRSKYLRIINNSYESQENIAVIFWDVNNLKKTNDTKGHETGDVLIRTIADSIHMLTTDEHKAFRIGGDEFVMIMSNSTTEDALKKINAWNSYIETIRPLYSFEISASVGYACGRGCNLRDIVNDADKMMYEEKQKYHARNK